MPSAHLTYEMTSPRSRPRKWSSLPRGTLSLRSPLPSGPTTREPHRRNHSSRPPKWALVSSTDLRFRSTSRPSLSRPPFTLVNNPRVLPLICINTTGVSATTPVTIRMPALTIPTSAGTPAAGSVGSSSSLCLSCALFATLPFRVFS